MKSILPQNNRRHRTPLKPSSSKRAAAPEIARFTAPAARRLLRWGLIVLGMALIHLTSGVLNATEPQISVPLVSRMHDVPTDMHILDWRKTALLYHQTMFYPNPGFSAPGFPTVYVAPNSSLFSFQPSLGAPA